MGEAGQDSNIRVLLVDDEDQFRTTLAKRLVKRGFTLLEASNGRDGLALLVENPIDVVVLDVKMPVMGGHETLRQIREKHPKVETILLTGHASAEDGVEGIKCGAFDYLSKPIELEHLASKIGQAFDKIKREEEKQKEIDFRARMEQQMIITERLASLGTMAAGIAHEINNPLSIIGESVGYMKALLKKDEAANVPFREGFELALGKIEKSVERSKKITHQLLGFVRKDDSVMAEINVKELVDEVVQLVEQEAALNEVAIMKDWKPGPVILWTDPSQLRQVLINLATNGLQASNRGTKLRIAVEKSGNDVVISVQDWGKGIPKENLNRIFEPFFTTKPPGQGTGLGLSISRSIVEKLCGKIEVESQLGKGSTFRITLPVIHKSLGQDFPACGRQEESIPRTIG